MISQCSEMCQCKRVPWIVLFGWNPLQIPTVLKHCYQWFEEQQCNAIKTVSRYTGFWNNVHWHIFYKPNIVLHLRWIRLCIQTGHCNVPPNKKCSIDVNMWTSMLENSMCVVRLFDCKCTVSIAVYKWRHGPLQSIARFAKYYCTMHCSEHCIALVRV